MNVKWLGVSLGTSTGIENVDGGFIQFPDFEPNNAVRKIVGDEFSQKIRQAQKYPGDTHVTMICAVATGKIEIWIERDYLKRPEKARFHSRDIIR